MELRQLLAVLRREWVAAAVALACCLALGAGAAFLPPKRYRAAVTLAVQPQAESASLGGVQMMEFLLPSLAAQAESADLRGSVERSLTRLGALSSAPFDVEATIEPGTGVFRITASSTDADIVAQLANEFGRQLVADNPYADVVKVFVLDNARAPHAPFAPARAVALFSGAVLGAILAVFAALGASVLRQQPAPRTSARVAA